MGMVADGIKIAMGDCTPCSAKLTFNSNQKLGRDVDTWVGSFNLPRVETCPGQSDLCKAKCYARHGNFCTKNTMKRARLNYEGSMHTDFVDTMVRWARRADVVRLHSSGDFYGPEYVRAWTEIAKRSPHAVFVAYTRSWVVPEILEALHELSAVENFELFLSTDDTMAAPPEGFRVAYMHAGWERPAGSLRCPNQVQHERGRKLSECVTCSECRVCYRPANPKGNRRDVEFKIH